MKNLLQEKKAGAEDMGIVFDKRQAELHVAGGNMKGGSHVGIDKSQEPEEQGANRRLQPERHGKPVKDVLGIVEHADKKDAHQGGCKAKKNVEENFPGGVHDIAGNLERRPCPEEYPADDAGGHG